MKLFKFFLLATMYIHLFVGGADLVAAKNLDIPIMKSFTIDLLEPFDESKRKLDTKHGAIGILQQYVSQVFKFGVGATSIFAVVMIMYGGYEYMVAGGESGGVESAKNRIMQALLGVALLLLAAVFLNFINPNFFKL